ncbi:MAG: substrate-binding domain-containing protein [Planctomycetaceae bacterium]|nr:substrate-binding domain-containing protein [Planctomycetaceae bacterium]
MAAQRQIATTRKHKPRKTDKTAPLRVLAIEMPVGMTDPILEQAGKAGWILSMSRYYHGTSARQCIEWWGADGVLVGPAADDAPHDYWDDCPVPVVHVSGWVAARNAIIPDCRAAGRMAAEHLIEHGFRRLVYLMMGAQEYVMGQREGFLSAAAAAGIDAVSVDWYDKWREFGEGPPGLRRFLAHTLAAMGPPVGLMVDEDWTALEAVEACREEGLEVPDRVAIVGVGNSPTICVNARVPLSSVDLNYGEMARQAITILADRMAGKNIPPGRVAVAPRGLVARRSSDILAADHPQVAKAIRFMWDRYADAGVGTPQVVAATSLSRTALTRAFKQCLGRTITKVLLDLRLRHARELLATTPLKVLQVASRCGFADANSLRGVLRRQSGAGPRAWRHQQQDGAAAPD